MSPTPRRRRSAPPPDPYPETGLAELGIERGDPVRFRRLDTERWKPATVARREKDGSLGLHDPKGAWRAIPVECIEVRDTGPRGGVVWEPLPERAARTKQMALLPAPTDSADRTARPPRSTATTRPPANLAPTGLAPDNDSGEPGETTRGRQPDRTRPDDEPGEPGQLSLL